MNMTSHNKRFLLILPCSKQKKHLDNVSAIDMYDGPFFKIIRKYDSRNVDILIISSKYGLIESNELVSYYDEKMTLKRSIELSEQIRLKLKKVLADNNYKEIFINLGKIYMLALEESRSMLEGKNARWSSGKIGERNRQLKHWLISTKSDEDLAP